MPGRAARQKGNRFEREVVNAHRDGIACNRVTAERIPLSGAAGGTFRGDVNVTYLLWSDYEGCYERTKWRAECKSRAKGFKQIYGWLEGNDLLFLKADRHEPLVVVPMSLWLRILGGEK